jgi:hypothetical protein
VLHPLDSHLFYGKETDSGRACHAPHRGLRSTKLLSRDIASTWTGRIMPLLPSNWSSEICSVSDTSSTQVIWIESAISYGETARLIETLPRPGCCRVPSGPIARN